MCDHNKEDTHLRSFGLPLHTAYHVVKVGHSNWFAYHWDKRATCFIQDEGNLIQLNDYTGGASLTSLHTTLDKAALCLKEILTSRV